MYIVICQKNLCIENIHNTAKGTLGLNTYDNLELISVHIPKCGGTTFGHILRRIYGDKFFHITDVSQLENIDTDIRSIHGHYHFNPKWFKIYPNAKVCVWIRHPIDRIISYYFFWSTYKFPPATFQNINKNHLDLIQNRYSIIEFAKKKYIRNRMFDYIEKESLDNINFIGDVSTYDLDLYRLSELMNWDYSLIKQYQSLNVSEYNSRNVFGKKFKITQRDREELADILDQDIRRYQYIKTYKNYTNNYWRYATCKEKREWDKILREKSYLPS